MLRAGSFLDQNNTEISRVTSISFGILRPDEIERLSVAEVTHASIYGKAGRPNDGGIHDLHMGTIDMKHECLTCASKKNNCPGHFGHIKLARSVYHIGYLNEIRRILRSVCFSCSRLKLDHSEPRFQQVIKIRNSKARGKALYKLCEKIKICSNEPIERNKQSGGSEDRYGGCGAKQPKIIKEGIKLRIEFKNSSCEDSNRRRDLSADDVLRVLKGISDLNCKALGLDPTRSRPEWMIISVLPVAPPCVRPCVTLDSSMKSEDDLTHQYTQILKTNTKLKSQIDKGAPQHLIDQDTQVLQFLIATLFNNELPGQPASKHRSGKPIKSFTQRIKGKEGRVRGNLMGKRVDFCARSVITPDPNLSLDQLGVPESIAKNLTIPETVTPYNIQKLRRFILNGPTVYPGAKYIIRPDGSTIDLRYIQKSTDGHIEYGYKVERHLCDGDLVIFNRQPSLHKMSMMAHSIKVLDYSTFRLNLSVTSPYNADFDGDEMNMHVPQSFDAKAELKELMHVPKQIVSPQSNRPVMGMVQDSLLGVSLFTRRDCFLEIHDVMNLLMWVDHFDGKLVQPAVLKPKALWTGKQVFSMILPNVNLVRFTNFHDPERFTGHVVDSEVLIEEGKLLTGIVDKRTVGASSGSLIHVIWMEHGPDATAYFLTICQKVINSWLLIHGFSVGISDTIANETTRTFINTNISSAKQKIDSLIQLARMGKIPCQPGKNMMDSFEYKVNTKLNSARDQVGKYSILNISIRNNIKAMVNAGSKGSEINICQIMACVGQQNVEGKRIPFTFDKRTLPHFRKDDFGPESRGFVENSYISGLTPSEFFFHAMGGREGLSDTAVKTSETGYIQRRLMKALEDVIVKYDGTVRNSGGNIIQFLYGEDGIAGEYIEDQKLESLAMDLGTLKKKYEVFDAENLEESVNKYRSVMKTDVISDILNDKETQEKCIQEFQRIKTDQIELRQIFKGFDDKQHLPVNIRRLIWNAKKKFHISNNQKTDLHPITVIQQVERLIERLSDGKLNQTYTEEHESSLMLFSIHVRSLLASKRVIVHERLTTEALEWIIGEIESRFRQAKAPPGEAVGSIAAQSIGEPGTQMTLNTFHFAGVSSKNVTLGVPRLVELINVGKNIKTPSLTIYISPNLSQDSTTANQIISKLEYTTLKHLSESCMIYYDPYPKSTILTQDSDLINSYFEFPEEDLKSKLANMSPWLLRIELNKISMIDKNLTMQDIYDKILYEYGEDLHCIYSDDNDDNLILRIRVIENTNQTNFDLMTSWKFLKDLEENLLEKLWVKGIQGLSKVVMKEVNVLKAESNGNLKRAKEWRLESDGCSLLNALNTTGIDHTRTVSNNMIETAEVLGIEAARKALMKELREVLNAYGIYVNYRHLAVLCDVMTQRGYLMSITRHGINRTECSPLHKASFEETLDMLLEASTYSEIDYLKGVTENIMLGQTIPVGTGGIDVLLNIDKINNAEVLFYPLEQPVIRDTFRDGLGLDEPPTLFNVETPRIVIDDCVKTLRQDTPRSYRANFSPDTYTNSYSKYAPPVHSQMYSNSELRINSPLYPPTNPFSNSTHSPPVGLTSTQMYSNNISIPLYSPRYQPYSRTSPAYSPTTPSYPPTSSAYSHTVAPYATTTTPNSHNRPAYSPTSPPYSRPSPTYSTTSPTNSHNRPANSHNRPAYSPTRPANSHTRPANSRTSPPYSTTRPANSHNRPANSHTRPANPRTSPPPYSPTTPANSHTRPANSRTSPPYSRTGPANSHTRPANSRTSPPYSRTSPPYSRTSPPYSPTSPVNSHTSPVNSHTRPAYSRTSPPNSHKSPRYSHSRPSPSNLHNSPSNSHTRPAYSHTSSSNSHNSPAYSQTRPAYSHTSPSNSHNSPVYSHTIPEYSRTSHSKSPTPNLFVRKSPSYNTSSKALISSPMPPSLNPKRSSSTPSSKPSKKPTKKEKPHIISIDEESDS